MAIYHLHTKLIKRSEGKSCVAAAAYRSATSLTNERTGLTHDFRNKGGVNEVTILAPKNSPEWVFDRATLWNSVERKENRKDAQTCREVEVSLPIELDNQQKKKLVTKYVEECFVDKGMIADIAFHKLGSDNPHAHILLTLRTITPDGFGNKDRDWNKKDALNYWRETWQNHTNLALYSTGSKSRIDHRTLKAQGIDRSPQSHLGPKNAAMLKKGGIIDRCFAEALYLLRKELKLVQREIKQFVYNISNNTKGRLSLKNELKTASNHNQNQYKPN